MLTRAEAYCWVAWMLGRESDALYYKPHRDEEDLELADELRRGADAFYEAAGALLPKPAQLELDLDDACREPLHEVWRKAIDKWSGVDRSGKAE